MFSTYWVDQSDGMLYRSGPFGPILIDKAHGSYEERDNYVGEDEL